MLRRSIPLVLMLSSLAIAQQPPVAPAPPAAAPVAPKPQPAAPVAPPAAPAAQAPAAPAPAPANNAPIRVKLLPQSINTNAFMNFDANGRVQNENSNFNINLWVAAENATIIGCKNVQFTRIVTDTGEELKPMMQPGNLEMGNNDPFVTINNGDQDPEAGRYSLSLTINPPTRPCRAIAEITCIADIEAAAGPLRQAIIEPVKQFEGKHIGITGVPDTSFTFSRDAGNVHVGVSHRLWSLLTKVRFTDNLGTAFNVNNSGGDSGNVMVNRQLELHLPDDGRVILELYTQIRTEKVTMTLKNMPLPGGGAAVPDVMVEAREIPGAGAIPALPGRKGINLQNNAQPALPRLEVELQGG